VSVVQRIDNDEELARTSPDDPYAVYDRIKKPIREVVIMKPTRSVNKLSNGDVPNTVDQQRL
jgi:hypothetical protein